MLNFIAEENDTLDRIDKYLTSKTDFSRAYIQKAIDQELVLVNDKICKSNYKVKVGDHISFPSHFQEETTIVPQQVDFEIVYEDDDILVINKPSGLVVHPANGHYQDTLVNGLLYHQKHLSTGNESYRPGIIHRIDKDTSGLILVAKNDKAHQILGEALKNREVKRKYLALVQGVISHNFGTIDAPIGRDINQRQQMKVTDSNAKNAVTHFTVLQRFTNATLIECTLETGRTHQIRVHMAYIKHPILNDPVYGPKKLINKEGQMLHAFHLTFKHPVTNEIMTFEVETPSKFKKVLDKLS